MKTLTLLLTLVSAGFGFGDRYKPAVLLVHGAFVDGSTWAKVIPILQNDGYEVTSVQIPLTSLADDVATTKRVLEAQKGPVVVVGHSYGGAVITDAAAGIPEVKALVYIAAFAPEDNEVLAAPGANFSPPELNSALIPDAAGFLYVDRSKFREVLCRDLSEEAARVAAVTQKPVSNSVFSTAVPGAAWKTIPSWYIVASEDHAINPELERFYAARMGATTTEVKSSHVVYLSHPKEVARVIEAAAAATH